MTDIPITILEPTIGAVIAGRCAQLWRPAGGMLSHCRPGDLLWVREPFHLTDVWDRYAPTAADARGARPTFSADLPTAPGIAVTGLGKRRAARTLPKAWHRQHLELTGVEEHRVGTFTHALAWLQGFANREAFAAAWDENIKLNGISHSWSENPLAVVLTFICVPLPLPAAPAHAPALAAWKAAQR